MRAAIAIAACTLATGCSKLVGIEKFSTADAPSSSADAPDDASVLIDAKPDSAVVVIDGMFDAPVQLDCTAAIACPTPSSGKTTVCGQLFDIETNSPVVATVPKTTCDPLNPSANGPCALAVQVYDAIAFAGDPQTATPLPNTLIVVDECGRFRIDNISPQGAAFLAVAVDNANGVATHRLSAITLPTAAGKAVSGVALDAVRVTTDQAWTTSAGLSGNTFVQRGVYVAIFLHGTAAITGVKITRAGGLDAANDYYFNDGSANARTTIDPAQIATGADGTGLMLGANGSLTQYSGTGAEPSGCKWPSNLGDQITGVAFVQQQAAVLSSDATMICP